ncbi:MAG: 30S ribosomal protein S18 [Planctomycetes bacterium]|nr:30S ribosomal protein S18 [Planctomycetota bacterium]
MAREQQSSNNQRRSKQRFAERRGKDWVGPLVDYKEVELLRKFMSATNKVMSRKRAGTDVQEQRAIKQAIKRARFIALIPYIGT